MSPWLKRSYVVRSVPILMVLSFVYVLQLTTLYENMMEKSVFKNDTDTEYIPLHTCNHNITNNTVINFEGVQAMNDIGMHGFDDKNKLLVCEKIDKARSDAHEENLPITVNITFSCKKLFENGGIGTANFLIYIYGIRLAAHVYGNVDLFITCNDAEETKYDLIIPWVTGWFPARPIGRNSSIPLTSEEACQSFANLPIGFYRKEIQHDLRRMAIALMGVPRENHPSALFAKKFLRSYNTSSPMVSSAIGSCPTLQVSKDNNTLLSTSSKYVIDDAVLHFRCGDLMDSDHPFYSYMTFNGYTRHISPNATSIGILTQPFEVNAQSRNVDSSQLLRDRCRIVVMSLIEYIQTQYPNAQINLHNNETETIALTYARMIMANQAIGGISTFSFLPLIATFGTAYMHSQSDSFPWLPPPAARGDSLILFQDSKLIKVSKIKSLWQTKGKEGVLDWFWNGTME